MIRTARPPTRRELDVRLPPRVRIRLFAKLWARLAGCCDGRRGALPAEDGYFDYTRQIAAAVRLAEAGIDFSLQAHLAAVDARIAAAKAAIATARKRLAAGPPTEDSASEPGSLAAIRTARVALRRRAEDERLREVVAEQERTVEALDAEQAALRRAARALLAAHVARHDALCAAHVRAWWPRVSVDDEVCHRASALPPEYRPTREWVKSRDEPEGNDRNG